jgi:hypothetical protein
MVTPNQSSSVSPSAGERRSAFPNVQTLRLATNDRSGNVSVFSGASTGRLVLVTLIPFPTNRRGASIASTGKCLVFGSGSTVSSFRFPELTLVNTVSVGSTVVNDMKIGKPGPNRYVAAVLSFTSQIAVIPLSPSTCALGTVQTIATSQVREPTGVDFSPRSDILYVGDANGSATEVEAFIFSRWHAASRFALHLLLRQKFERGVGEQRWTTSLRRQRELGWSQLHPAERGHSWCNGDTLPGRSRRSERVRHGE